MIKKNLKTKLDEQQPNRKNKNNLRNFYSDNDKIGITKTLQITF